MAAALVRRQRVNLVDDHRSGGREHAAARLRSKQDIKRFRRRDDDVGWPAAHALALSRGCIAGAHPRADLDIAQALLPQRRTDAGQRRLEIFPDIVRERLQRGDVDDLGLVPQRSVKSLPHQIVDRRHEGGKRLPGTCRRGNQHIAAGLDGRPRLRLRGCRGAETCAQTKRQQQDGITRTNSSTETLGRSLPAHALRMRHEQTLIFDNSGGYRDRVTLDQRPYPAGRVGSAIPSYCRHDVCS